MPCFNALFRDFFFPSSVFGPVLICAFRRFASICFRDVILISSSGAFGAREEFSLAVSEDTANLKMGC
jgi:hypothetical protein